MREIDARSLDNWITGHYGEDQFSKYDEPDPKEEEPMIDYAEYQCDCALYAPGGIPDLCPVHGVPQRALVIDDEIATPEPHFFAHLSEEQKLKATCAMIDMLTQDQKDAILMQLAREQPQGNTHLQVNSNEKFVRLDFGRTLAWFVLPKPHALQLGIILMQHAGANVAQVPNPTQTRVPGNGGSNS